MKKSVHFVVLLTAAGSMALSGCDRRNESTTSSTTTETTAVEEAPPAEPAPEVAAPPAPAPKKHKAKKKKHTSMVVPVPVDEYSLTEEELYPTESAMTEEAPVAAEPRALTPKEVSDITFERQDAISKFYEPQSRNPDNTGTTSITGMDRSMAQFTSGHGVFTDPTVEAKKDWVAASEPIDTVAIDRYTYAKRGQFKDLMEDRLTALQEDISGLRNTAKYKQEAPSNSVDVIASMQARYKDAKSNLHIANKVSAANWDTYRSNFRDQVADLERSVSTLQTTMNTTR